MASPTRQAFWTDPIGEERIVERKRSWKRQASVKFLSVWITIAPAKKSRGWAGDVVALLLGVMYLWLFFLFVR
jgi:hypothetical protein